MNNPDLVLLWHCAFYDHPLDGVAVYKGEPVWFSVIDDGGWTGVHELPLDRSTLSKYELESITKEELREDPEDEYWCKDGIIGIYKLTDEQFQLLNERQNKALRYGFGNDHRPEIRNTIIPEFNTDDYFKLSESERKLTEDKISRDKLSKGEKLGEFRWFEFTNWFRK